MNYLEVVKGWRDGGAISPHFAAKCCQEVGVREVGLLHGAHNVYPGCATMFPSCAAGRGGAGGVVGVGPVSRGGVTSYKMFGGAQLQSVHPCREIGMFFFL